MSSAAVHPAVAAWVWCEAADHWPRRIDRLLTATWRGIEIGWPQFEGESFEIYRIGDSSVVTDEQLPGDDALALEWRAIPLPGPFAWHA